MYKNSKILIGKNEGKETNILPKMANRHGVITGASGSGKTITLKVMGESFSDAGIPVFMVDVKGDLAATAKKGEGNEKLNERINSLKLEDFEFKNYPVTFWDIYGENGHPISIKLKKMGSKLLAKMLNLTETQESVLAIAYKISEDENLELEDLNDMKALLQHIGNNRKEYSFEYGNIPTQTLTIIIRRLVELEEDGGGELFGEPSFDFNDFIRFDPESGNSYINILDASKLFNTPNLYSTFLLWLLSFIYEEMPEVGDLDKPKLVLFFDEAHLIFDNITSSLLSRITQIIKLIRSKGVGVYFISQIPSDIPDEILSQLGNRVQHLLRYYTKADEKAIKAAANSFRINKNFNIEEEIKKLGTGEALVSFINEKGEPEVTEKVFILPPQSLMGTIDKEERDIIIRMSQVYGKYENKLDNHSALEKILDKQAEEKEKERELEESEEQKRLEQERIKKEEAEAKQKEKEAKEEERRLEKEEAEKRRLEKELERKKEKEEAQKRRDEKEAERKAEKEKNKKSTAEKLATKVGNSALSVLGRKIGNMLFKWIK